MPRFQQHHVKTFDDQTLTQPLRQRACLETDPGDWKPKFGEVPRECPGSLATFVSRMILPDASTTQTLLCSSDTSIPA